MLHRIADLYQKIIHAGVENKEDEFLNKTIILNNLNWIYFTIIFSIYGIVGYFQQVHFALFSCLLIVLIYSSVYLTSYYKKINTSKNLNLILLTIFTFTAAVVYGRESNLIYFYFPILVMVFLLFTIKDVKYIIFHFLSIATLFLLYYYQTDFFQKYAFYQESSLFVGKMVIPFQIFNLFLILYFGFKRNSDNELKIIAQKKYFEKILNTIPIEIVVMDGEFRYQFVNKTAIKDDTLREWIIGKNDYDYVFHREKSTDIADYRFATYESVKKIGFVNFEEVLQLKNGKKKYTDKTLLKLTNNEINDEVNYLGFSLDTTLKREAEELLKEYMLKLEKSNEEIKQFAYITSHDLKSPLRNIISLLQLTKKKNEHIIKEDSKELIEICINSANSLYNIVSDVLLYTMSEVDQSTFSEINLDEVLAEVLSNINSYIIEHNAIVNVKKRMPIVFSHKTMMLNLFSNIVQNGIKYNKSEIPIIDIDVEDEGSDYLFSIKDNGIGIDPKFSDQVFLIFKRLHTQQEFEGTGIGLSICKKIIDNLNGQIWVQSEIGEGSTFFVRIPKN